MLMRNRHPESSWSYFPLPENLLLDLPDLFQKVVVSVCPGIVTALAAVLVHLAGMGGADRTEMGGNHAAGRSHERQGRVPARLQLDAPMLAREVACQIAIHRRAARQRLGAAVAGSLRFGMGAQFGI